MRIALLTRPGQFEIREEKVPEPGPDEARIRVAAAGICGTDIEAFSGRTPRGWQVSYPFRMGHELAGVVDQIGPGVNGLQEGDLVVPDGRVPCGQCSYCRRGLFNSCIQAGYISGGFMEYSVYPGRNLVKVPDAVPPDQAAMAEPLSCCLYGSSKLDVSLGDTAVVVGDGPIGIMHSQLLTRRGARVLLLGIADEKLQVARLTGAEVVVNGCKENAADAVREFTNGQGAELVVVAAGSESILEQALSMAARGGQVLYFAAAMKERLQLPLDLVHYKELKLIGSYDSTIAYFEDALRVMDCGLVDLEPLITGQFSLEDIQEAFETARKREGLKIIIRPGEGA
jgi:L-iditol 2-dehydrogenase